MNALNVATEIIKFRDKNGRFWKSKLNEVFQKCSPEVPELIQFRNYFLFDIPLSRINDSTTIEELEKKVNKIIQDNKASFER